MKRWHAAVRNTWRSNSLMPLLYHPQDPLSNQGNRQELPSPPVNQSSSLMAVQPCVAAADVDISMAQPATFDIQNLQLALTRSQQTSGSTSLRCGNTLELMQQPEAPILSAILGHPSPSNTQCTPLAYPNSTPQASRLSTPLDR